MSDSGSELSIAAELADFLMSGVTGVRLMAELRVRFSHANRSDVFFGVAIAISLFEADRLVLMHELSIAEGNAAEPKSERADER